MDKNLKEVSKKIYDKCFGKIQDLRLEEQSEIYSACQFTINDKKIICRSSKITPKKNGQFVTFWKRNKIGTTEPYKENDLFDYYVINTRTKNSFGQFVFPKSELIAKGLVTTKREKGKRGFRVYPIWDTTENKQAQKTQQWQLIYFYEINASTDLKKVEKLYGNR